MLIKAYGEFWNPFATDWKSKELLGKGLPKNYRHEINFWEAKGIYVLLREFRPVYVGKSWADRIGPRLYEHLADKFAGRWDMFSWYSVSKPNKTTKDVNSPKNRPVPLRTAIATLES